MMSGKVSRYTRGTISGGEAAAVEYEPGNSTKYRALWTRSPEMLATLGLNAEDSRRNALLSVLGFGVVVVSDDCTELDLIRGLRCSQGDAAALVELVRWCWAQAALPGAWQETDERYSVLYPDAEVHENGLTLEEAKASAGRAMDFHKTAAVHIISESSGREVIP